MLYSFCPVSTEAAGVVPHWRCYTDGDEHKTFEMRGSSWRCQWVMQAKEAADLREMRSCTLQELLLGHISVHQCHFSTERKTMLMKFIVDMMLGGISLKGCRLLRRSCLQLWETWAPALTVGTMAHHFQNMVSCCPKDELFPACASFNRILCDRLSITTPVLPLIFAARSVKELSDITDGHLEECLYQYFPSPLFYQLLRVKHMLKHLTGSRPILMQVNQTGTTMSGQEMMGQCSPGKHVNCH